MKLNDDFIQKVQSLSKVELIEGFISSLENPTYNVYMGTLGNVKDKQCYGCAATNYLANLTGIVFYDKQMKSYYKSCKLGLNKETSKDNIKCSKKVTDFIYKLEFAFTSIAVGNIEQYNIWAYRAKIIVLPTSENKLPSLSTDNYKENLIYFKNYLNKLKNE